MRQKEKKKVDDRQQNQRRKTAERQTEGKVENRHIKKEKTIRYKKTKIKKIYLSFRE